MKYVLRPDVFLLVLIAAVFLIIPNASLAQSTDSNDPRGDQITPGQNTGVGSDGFGGTAGNADDPFIFTTSDPSFGGDTDQGFQFTTSNPSGGTSDFGYLDAPESGLVTCGTDNLPPCNACHAVSLANDLINFLIIMMSVIAVIAMVYAGFMLVTSGGDQSAAERAKKMFTNVVIGIILILASWLIVDTLLKTISGSGLSFWSAIECTAAPAGSSNTTNRSQSGSNNAPVAGEVTTNGGYTFDPGISGQQFHASPGLNSLLDCMRAKMPAGVGRISSISDQRILDGTHTFEFCDANGQAGGCAHSANSCHYGRTNPGQSHAVDFGDQENSQAIISAARECGGTPIDEGSHIHVSASSCR